MGIRIRIWQRPHLTQGRGPAHYILHEMGQPGTSRCPQVLSANVRCGLFLALDTRCWPGAEGSPAILHLLPLGVVINSTHDLWLKKVPVLSCQPLQGKAQEARRSRWCLGESSKADRTRQAEEKSYSWIKGSVFLLFGQQHKMQCFKPQRKPVK